MIILSGQAALFQKYHPVVFGSVLLCFVSARLAQWFLLTIILLRHIKAPVSKKKKHQLMLVKRPNGRISLCLSVHCL
jgi:hypothetical protein